MRKLLALILPGLLFYGGLTTMTLTFGSGCVVRGGRGHGHGHHHPGRHRGWWK